MISPASMESRVRGSGPGAPAEHEEGAQSCLRPFFVAVDGGSESYSTAHLDDSREADLRIEVAKGLERGAGWCVGQDGWGCCDRVERICSSPGVSGNCDRCGWVSELWRIPEVQRLDTELKFDLFVDGEALVDGGRCCVRTRSAAWQRARSVTILVRQGRGEGRDVEIWPLGNNTRGRREVTKFALGPARDAGIVRVTHEIRTLIRTAIAG